MEYFGWFLRMVDVEKLGRKNVGLVVLLYFWFYLLFVVIFAYAVTALRSAGKFQSQIQPNPLTKCYPEFQNRQAQGVPLLDTRSWRSFMERRQQSWDFLPIKWTHIWQDQRKGIKKDRVNPSPLHPKVPHAPLTPSMRQLLSLESWSLPHTMDSLREPHCISRRHIHSQRRHHNGKNPLQQLNIH